MSDLFLEVLDQNRKEVFSKLEKFTDIGILAGGTALALQIGHRLSFDFDIFTSQPLPSNLWNKVRRVFGPDSIRTMDVEGQLNFVTPRAVSVTFFHTDFPPLFPTVKTSSIDLFDYWDIATNKAYTIGRRGKWRDYVDLYFLLAEDHVTLREIVDLAQKRYQNEFPTKLFLEQLCYFDDIGNYDIKFSHEEISPETIKTFLVKETQKITSPLATF